MKNLYSFSLLKRLQNLSLLQMATLLAVAGFLFFSSADVSAQPEFSASELRLMRERKLAGNALKYRMPQEKFPMPEISNQNRSLLIDGDIDSTFNASVTEGFGYANETIVQPDGKIIAVGLFQRANGTRTNGIARFNADGTLDTSFNSEAGANAAIRAVALQSDGKIIIGGAFTFFNGFPTSRIARLNSNGSIDLSFSAGNTFNNQVNDIRILPDGKIMVGGAFNLSSSRLARLNSNGTLDTSIAGFNGTVMTIALAPDGKILIGGQFSLPEPTIARLNADGTFDSTFNPTTGGDSGFPVYKIVVQPNGKILAAGAFQTFNGTATDGLVRLNDNGTIDTTFEITSDPQIQSLEVFGLALQPDGKILASFFDNASEALADVRRFNADGSADATFDTNTNDYLSVLDLNLLADGKILAAGYFVSVNNQQHLRLMKLNSNGSVDNAFNPSLSSFGIVYVVKRQADGKILIGGDFEYVNGVKKRAMARLNADGSLDNTFTLGAGFFGDVYDIEAQSDGKINIGGLFSGDNNFSAYSAARLNANGNFDANLNDFPERFIAVAYDLALQSDGKILIGGQIYNSSFSGFVTASRVNSNVTLDTTFTPVALPNGTVRAILVQPSGKIIIGGTFFSNGTFQRAGLARLNSDGSLDSATFGGNGNVASIRQSPDGAIYAGGFTLTRHSSEGVFDPTLNVGTGFNSQIRAVELQPDGKVLLGGFFTTYNGATVNRIIRISSNGALDSTFNPGAGPSGTVFALNLQPDGKLLVGGQFLDFNNTEKLSLVRLQNTAAIVRAPFDFDGDGRTDIAIFRPSVGEWWINRSSNATGYALQFGASSDKIAPADFTGDGKTDVAFWRPSTGEWFVLRSEDFSYYSFPFGTNGDVPAPADFDADGKADATVFRPSTSTWYVMKSTGGTLIQTFGQTGDVPVVADYDGDNKADIAIYRVSAGEWWIQRSTAGLIAFQFGNSTDKPAQGDFTGDGKADVALWRPTTGEWFVLRSENQSYYSFGFGTSGDTPAPGNYDGDGKFDAAVFRPSTNTWYVNKSTGGNLIQTFGQSGDLPVPNAFVP